jgi:hypothetical protein
MGFLKKLFQSAEEKGKRRSRGGKRFSQNLEFEVKGLDADGNGFSVRTRTTNLSGEGGCLRLPRNVEVGNPLTLKDNRGDIYTAKVCWHKFDMESETCLVGFMVLDNSHDWALNMVSILGKKSN